MEYPFGPVKLQTAEERAELVLILLLLEYPLGLIPPSFPQAALAGAAPGSPHVGK